MNRFLSLCLFLTAAAPFALSAAPLVYEGEAGPGKGKHIVLVANDHNYRSQEAIPALARILAKHHGFRCTVLFGLDPETGNILPGESNIPGLEILKEADLLVLYTRFQNLPGDQMQHFVEFLDRAGPIVALRTSTHAFKIPADAKYAKYSYDYPKEDYPGGFGRQVLGETWNGHHGKNNEQSTRLDILPNQAGHPILRGVKSMWAACGGYYTEPTEDCEVLALAQPLNGMSPDSPVAADMKPAPGAWTKIYEGREGRRGRSFTSTYGASDDLLDEGYRRSLINACFWALGMEDKITPEANIAFVGPYHPTYLNGVKPDWGKPEALAGWETPIGKAAD